MGVMACDRKDCENVMCSRYHEDYGYICEDCFEELEDLLNIDVENKTRKKIKEFMETPRKESNSPINSLHDIFPRRDY